MNHFNDEHGPSYRYKNELLSQMRKQTELLETLVQLLSKEGGNHASDINKSTSVRRTSQGQQGQRDSNRKRHSTNQSK